MIMDLCLIQNPPLTTAAAAAGVKMASIQTIPVSHPFPSTLNHQTKSNSTHLFLSPPPRATDPNQTETNTDDTATSSSASASSNPETAAFESRLSQVRLKYRSGTGKKAEQRRAKTNKKSISSSSASNSSTMMLPPVPLKEPVSAATGLKVEMGFTPYSERLNGAVAALGLAALVLVELGSGQGLFKYHAGPTILIQVYTVAALAAVFVKYEREKSSVWPEIEIPLAATTTKATEE